MTVNEGVSLTPKGGGGAGSAPAKSATEDAANKR